MIEIQNGMQKNVMTYQDEIFEIEGQDNYFQKNKKKMNGKIFN